MTSEPVGNGETSDRNLTAASTSVGAAVFLPPRYVTGALLKKMGWEFIRPDQIKSQWKIIHKEKP